MKSKSYPGVHNAELHPKAGNIAKKCQLCASKNKRFGNMSLIKRDDGYHISICHELFAASLYSDEDVYVNGVSDKPIKCCPECGRKL